MRQTHMDMLLVGSQTRFKRHRRENKATIPITLLVISPSLNRFVVFCKAKRVEQQLQRACNTFNIILMSYFINRKGLIGPRTIQFMWFCSVPSEIESDEV